jgi:hypothetical protein
MFVATLGLETMSADLKLANFTGDNCTLLSFMGEICCSDGSIVIVDDFDSGVIGIICIVP